MKKKFRNILPYNFSNLDPEVIFHTNDITLDRSIARFNNKTAEQKRVQIGNEILNNLHLLSKHS
jgi:hypothetical protein